MITIINNWIDYLYSKSTFGLQPDYNDLFQILIDKPIDRIILDFEIRIDLRNPFLYSNDGTVILVTQKPSYAKWRKKLSNEECKAECVKRLWDMQSQRFATHLWRTFFIKIKFKHSATLHPFQYSPPLEISITQLHSQNLKSKNKNSNFKILKF